MNQLNLLGETLKLINVMFPIAVILMPYLNLITSAKNTPIFLDWEIGKALILSLLFDNNFMKIIQQSCFFRGGVISPGLKNDFITG